MKKLSPSGYLLVAMSALGFSFKSILVKYAYGYGVDALTLMLMRLGIATPFFVAALFILEGRRGFQITLKDAMVFVFMGIMGIGGAMLFSFYSLELIDASLSTLIVFTYPAVTTVMLMIFMKEEVTSARFVSLFLTFAGLGMVVRIDKIALVYLNGKGIMFGLFASLCFAIYNTMSEKMIKDTSPVRLTSYCSVSLFAFLFTLFGNRSFPDAPEVWVAASLLGIFSGFIPFVLFMYGVRKIGAGRSVIISSLGPVFTVLWAYLFLEEHLDTTQIVGMSTIILGVTLLKLKSPFQLITGTGDEVMERLNEIGVKAKNEQSRRVFALIYLPGMIRRSLKK